MNAATRDFSSPACNARVTSQKVMAKAWKKMTCVKKITGIAKMPRIKNKKLSARPTPAFVLSWISWLSLLFFFTHRLLPFIGHDFLRSYTHALQQDLFDPPFLALAIALYVLQ